METAQGTALQVVVSNGSEDPERALLGLNSALAAASTGLDTVVFFTLTGSQWACAEQSIDTPVAQEIDAVMKGLIEMNVRLECCSACLSRYCAAPDADGDYSLRPDIHISGLVSLVQRAAAGVPSLSL